MKIERPHFELTRVYSDGTQEAPEIIPVGTMPWDTRMERRGFIGVGVGLAGVLLLVDGKADAQSLNASQQSASGLVASNDVPTKVPEKVLNAHIKAIHALAFSPDGKILASGSADETVKLWSLPPGKLLATLEGHKEFVRALTFSTDGRGLASGAADNTVKLWSLPDGKLLATVDGPRKMVNTLAISRDGKTVASATFKKKIELWRIPEGTPLATLKGHKPWATEVVISDNGMILASGSSDNLIKLWSLPKRKLVATLKDHKGDISALAISPDERILASGSSDHTVKLWSLPTGTLMATLEGHKDSVFTLAFSPDGGTLASGSADQIIKLWLLAERRVIANLEGNQHAVSKLAFSPDGKEIASGDAEGVIILWDLGKHSFQTFLFDPKASQTDAISYNVYDKVTGNVITYTLPCGSPIPPGAVCTCNCVPGTYRPQVYSSPSTGSGSCSCVPVCTCNQVCTCIPVPSDRDVKEAFKTADPITILQRLAELPIQQWNYKWDDASVRHIGPMAQDFAAAFAVGEDDKHIHPVDAQGVAFAAIQGLYSLLKENETNTEKLRAQLRQHREENEVLKARVEAMERPMSRE